MLDIAGPISFFILVAAVWWWLFRVTRFLFRVTRLARRHQLPVPTRQFGYGTEIVGGIGLNAALHAGGGHDSLDPL